MSEHVDIVKRTAGEKKPEIWMERIHGRGKGKTFFKGCVNKVLISTLVLSSVLSTATPAFAAEKPENYSNYNSYDIIQSYDISVKSAITNLKNTISIVNGMKSMGVVSQSTLETLAQDLYALEKSVKTTDLSPSKEAVNIVLAAENALSEIPDAGEARVALNSVKSSFNDMDSTLSFTIKQNKTGKYQLKSFSDVPTSFWAHDAIMDMVSRGMFAGTEDPDANGVGKFNPKGTMTRAQFITVITRYLYKDELATMPIQKGQVWYQNNYMIAVEKGLIKKSDFSMDTSVMSAPMNREEMAYVLVRAMDILGESAGSTISNSRIPDYNSIGTAYRSHVKIAYTKGLIVGTDAKGTFNPKGTLNRAQAATVIYRLIAPETRQPVDPNISVTPTPSDTPTTAAQTWVEGQAHGMPKVGDTVIKADGTKVVIKRGIGNVLGAGQGVDIWSGYKQKGNIVTGYNNGIDGPNDTTSLFKDSVVGEMHTRREWSLISQATDPDGKYIGEYDGEVMNTWWKWSSDMGLWIWQAG